MAPSDHAKLSPSGAAMWSACPASIAAQEAFKAEHPDRVRGDTIHSIRGTQAHAVAEAFVLGEEAVRPLDKNPMTDDEWEEMCYHGQGYSTYVKSLCEEGDLLLVEKRVHMKQVDDDMFGTSDIVLYKKKTRQLHIIDLKYGRGEVSAHENPQLMLYALGSSNTVEDMGFKPKGYKVHIYQPRTPGDAVDSYEFSNIRLMTFAYDMKVAAVETRQPNARFNPGDKQCQWCDAAPTCKAFAEFSVKKSFDLLDLLDDINPVRVGMACDELSERDPSLMHNDQLVALRELFPAAKKWMEAVDKFLLLETQSGSVDSLKIVEGRGSNVCIDPDAVEFMIGEAAFKPLQLKSVTELKRVTGPKNFNNVLGDYFEKRSGKPTLVGLDDKRPALKTDADLLKMLDDE
jgi:hypothetical protein